MAFLMIVSAVSTALLPALADAPKKSEKSKQSLPATNPLSMAPELSQKTLVVAVSEQPPFSMKDDDGKWVGIAVELWERIASKLKLKYEYRTTDLVGAVKGMDDRSFDVEAIPAFITDDGEEHMDFTAPYYAEDIAVAINSDQQVSFMQAARSTLSSVQFLALLCGITGITVFGAVALWLLEHKGDSEHYKGKTLKALARSLYWSISILTGRDFPSSVGLKAYAPTTRGGQFFALTWTMAGVMVFSLFTASAASLLTSRQLQAIVGNWSDLKHLHVGTVDDPDSHAFLQQRHIQFKSYDTPLRMMAALSEHKVDAAVFPRSGLTYCAHNVFNDKIVVLPLSSQQTYMGLPLQLGSPLRKQINTALLGIIQTKSWRKVLAQYLGGGTEKTSNSADETSPSDSTSH